MSLHLESDRGEEPSQCGLTPRQIVPRQSPHFRQGVVAVRIHVDVLKEVLVHFQEADPETAPHNVAESGGA